MRSVQDLKAGDRFKRFGRWHTVHRIAGTLDASVLIETDEMVALMGNPYHIGRHRQFVAANGRVMVRVKA